MSRFEWVPAQGAPWWEDKEHEPGNDAHARKKARMEDRGAVKSAGVGMAACSMSPDPRSSVHPSRAQASAPLTVAQKRQRFMDASRRTRSALVPNDAAPCNPCETSAVCSLCKQGSPQVFSNAWSCLREKCPHFWKVGCIAPVGLALTDTALCSRIFREADAPYRSSVSTTRSCARVLLRVVALPTCRSSLRPDSQKPKSTCRQQTTCAAGTAKRAAVSLVGSSREPTRARMRSAARSW